MTPPLLLALTLTSLCGAALAGHVTYELTVTYGVVAPDCVNKQVLLINGEYPGPTLTGTEGDTMTVILRNGLSMEGLTMHWHGIRQRGTNLNDGTAFVTQCPINPMDFLNYTFVLDKAGTFMYHGHLDDQVGAGLYGKLWVYEAPSKPLPYKYDGELGVIFNDWWHRSVQDQVVGLDSIPFVWVGEPQSLLLNGRGEYNCSLIPQIPNPLTGDARVCNSTFKDCAIEIFEVEQGKTYRFRISSIASLSSLNFAIEGHSFTVVLADAYSVKPFVVGPEGLDVYSGQTYDVILKADKPIGNYWVRTAVFARRPNTPFGKAVLRYKGAAAQRPLTPLPPVRLWNDTGASLFQANRIKGLMQGEAVGGQVPPVPLQPGEVPGSAVMCKTQGSPLLLWNSQQLYKGRIRWAINNITYMEAPVPLALGINTDQEFLYAPSPQETPFTPWNPFLPPPTNATASSGYYKFEINAVVDMILQNSNNLSPNASDYHPWHMHGHSFWVLGYGQGLFTSADHKSLNLVDPPLRNTVTLFPYGWTVIRFVADNPGAWMMHCHIAPHLHMGMAITFVDGDVLPVPNKIQRCGIFYKK